MSCAYFKGSGAGVRGENSRQTSDLAVISQSPRSEIEKDLRGFEWRVLWQLTRGEESFVFTNAALAADCLAVTPDGQTLISGGTDGTYLWDLRERKPLGLFPGPHPGPTRAGIPATMEELRPMLDASPAVVDYLKVHPAIFDYLDAWGRTNHTRSVRSLSLTPDSQHLLVGSRDYVRCWDFSKREFGFAVPEADGHLAFFAGGDSFAVGVWEQLYPDIPDRSAHPYSVVLYSFASRRAQAVLPGYGREVAITSDGQIVAATGSNGLALWRPLTGETVKTHTHNFFGRLAFAPDNRTLAISGTAATIEIWDAVEVRPRAYLVGESYGYKAVAWSPDGRRLATGGDDQVIHLWNVPPARPPDQDRLTPETIRPDRTLRGHESSVRALVFLPDGKRLASASDDKTIRLWHVDVTGGPTAIRDPLPKGAINIRLEPVTGCLVCRVGRVLAVWDPKAGAPAKTLPDTEGQLLAGLLASGSGLVTVRAGTNGMPTWAEIRALPEGEVRARIELPPLLMGFEPDTAELNRRVAVSPDGQWLALGRWVTNRVDGGNDVLVYSLAARQVAARLETPLGAMVNSLAFSPDSRWFVITDEDSKPCSFAVFETGTWRRQSSMVLTKMVGALVTASFDPFSARLATCGNVENSVRIWDVATGRLLGRCNGRSPGEGPVWSPDGRTLVTGGYRDVKLWSMTVFRELATLDNTPWNVPLGFTADGRALLTIGMMLKTWSPPTLAEIEAQER